MKMKLEVHGQHTWRQEPCDHGRPLRACVFHLSSPLFLFVPFRISSSSHKHSPTFIMAGELDISAYLQKQ